MRRKSSKAAPALLLCLTALATVLPFIDADGVQLRQQVLSAGGCIGAASADYRLHATVVQTAVGVSRGAGYILGHGFWSGTARLDCCAGRVGDANGSGDDEPTIGDVSVMIDAKFITGSCEGILSCLTESDINQSGGASPTCDDITIGDIAILIDYLFITGPSLGLPPCL